MTRPSILGLLGFAVFASSPFTAVAQEDNADRELVLRTYPVADIVFQVSDYPSPVSDDSLTSGGGQNGRSRRGGFGGGGGGGLDGGGAFAIPDHASRSRPVRVHPAQFGGGGAMGPEAGGEHTRGSASISMNQLVDTIYELVAPDRWTGEAAIKPLGEMLIVRQTTDVHDELAALLDAIRQDAGRRQTVTVDARWLTLDTDELATLTRDTETEAEGDQPTLNPEALAAATRRSTTLRCMTNCFSGQLVYVVGGTQRNVVQSYIPVVGSVGDTEAAARLVSRPENRHGKLPARTAQLVSDSSTFGNSKSVGYQPVIGTHNVGVVLEVRPTLMGDEQTAIVDLRFTVTGASDAGDEAPAPAAAAALTPSVDRWELERQELATTLRMPLGEPVLVGGVSHRPNSAAQQGGQAAAEQADVAPAAKQLYLVLEVR